MIFMAVNKIIVLFNLIECVNDSSGCEEFGKILLNERIAK